MLNTAREIIDVCNSKNIRLYDLVLVDEIESFHTDELNIRARLDDVIKIMRSSATSNLDKKDITKYRMIDGFAKLTNAYARDREPIVGSFLTRAMAMAFSTSEVNAAMGKIVAAPTAGSSGIMPAAMIAAIEKYNFDQRTIQNGLLTSIAIGQIVGKYATFAGAEGGCQAECGAASAMAAAALVEMLGGSVGQILNAASITIINVLGLVCDPIAGLVQYPCTFRNASGVINSFIAADLALAGVASFVPFEEVVQAMGEVGHLMHESLRETGLGGLASTKTGQRIRKEFLGENL